MAETNTEKSFMDSDGMNFENVQNIAELANNLIDKLPDGIKDDNKNFDQFNNETDKQASNISNLQMHKTKYEDGKLINESKEKLDDLLSGVTSAFSGITNDLTKFGNEFQEKASEIVDGIKDDVKGFANVVSRNITEDESEKIERRNDSISDAMSKENDFIKNVGEVLPDISSGFDEISKKINEAADKIKHTVENADEIYKFGSSGNEIQKSEKEEEQHVNEFMEETFENIQKLKEDAKNKIMEGENFVEKKLQDFKEGINESLDEVYSKEDNEKKDIIDESDDGKKQAVGMEAENDGNFITEEICKKMMIPATENLDDPLLEAPRSNICNNVDEKSEANEEIILKKEYNDEIQSITKIIPPEDDKKQEGTASETDIHNDDCDLGKSEDTVTTKLKAVVNDTVEEVDKILEEANNIGKKLLESEAVDDMINQKDMQSQKLHDIMTGPNNDSNMKVDDSNIKIDDSKLDTSCAKEEEQKLSNVSPQFSLISQETEQKAVMDLAENTELKGEQPEIITESPTAASEYSEKQHSSNAAPESSVETEKQFFADEKKTAQEIKLIPDLLQSRESPERFSNQSLTPEDTAGIFTTSTGPGNTLQSADRDAIDIKVETDRDRINSKAEIDQIEQQSKLEHQLPVSLPSKNVPPPVPPKKKSVEMILAEEAKAMLQSKLRGIETLNQKTEIPEIEKDEPKSESKKSAEITEIEEQIERAADRSDIKHDMILKFEFEKPDKPAVAPIQNVEPQKTAVDSIQSTASPESQEEINDKDKMDTMESKSAATDQKQQQQQQTRRCTIL